MNFVSIIGTLVLGAFCIFVVHSIAKSTGRFSPEGEATVGVLGGFGLFAVVLFLLLTFDK